MALFNPKTIDAAMRAFAFEPTQQQLAGAAHWSNLLRSGLFMGVKETALEADFNRYVVQDVLGYRSFDPAGTTTVSVKQQIGAGEVDLALGHFAPGRANVLAPFELKGPSLKNLDAIMPGRAKTPVQQAWEYANDAVGARWVLVSNQVEVRFYAVGRGRRDYETFDLQRLDDPVVLKRFVLLLGAERLLPGETQRLLERSLVEDKDITNALYREYRGLRDDLLQFIRDQHPEVPPEEAIRQAQTIMDRVIFIAFAEDTVLLPKESLKRAVQFDNPYDPRPKWEYVKQLFNAVDQGNKRLDVPPYNGGLFAPDAALDELEIPDHLCERFAGISSYDFESQVSVTILGHIFEQSITDIEKLQAEARGEAQPKATKRKREGVVYTPDFVTRFIVEHTIGAHLAERLEQLMTEHALGVDDDGNVRWRGPGSERALWRAYLEALTSMRIVDPACGSGAFLIATFDYLKAEQTRVRERLAELEPGLLVHASADADVEIVTRNLYGVDVNAESVEITKLSLWLKTAKRGRQLESLDRTIRWGNSLIEDSDVHRRAFVWRDAFGDVFDQGGFDIVLGNPPYVRMELIKPFKPYLQKRYEVVADRADLYAYFFELGVRLLKPGGRLGYICSSTFFRTGSGEALRRYMAARSEIETVVDFGELQIFEGVTTYPAILTLRRTNGHSVDDAVRFLNVAAVPDDLSKAFEASAQSMPRSRLTSRGWRFEADRLDAIRAKMAAARPTLADVYGPPLRGIVTGLNEAFVLDRATRDALIACDPRSSDLLKPFLVGENLKRWHVEPDDLWLIYTPKKRVDIEDYRAVRDHLARFRERLEARATQQEWWELQQAQAAYQPYFDDQKVIWPHFQHRASFSRETTSYYLNNKCFFWSGEHHALELLLNSSAAWFFVRGLARIKRGGFLEMEAQYVGQVPSVELTADDQAKALAIADAVNEQLVATRRFISRLRDFAPTITDDCAGAFAGWAEGTFSDLLGCVRRVLRTDIPVTERDEWEAYFNARRSEVAGLSARVADMEAEIDDRINTLYGLDADEIALIEESRRANLPEVASSEKAAPN